MVRSAWKLKRCRRWRTHRWMISKEVCSRQNNFVIRYGDSKLAHPQPLYPYFWQSCSQLLYYAFWSMDTNDLLRNNGLEYSVVSSECENTGSKKGRGMYLQTLHHTRTCAPHVQHARCNVAHYIHGTYTGEWESLNRNVKYDIDIVSLDNYLKFHETPRKELEENVLRYFTVVKGCQGDMKKNVCQKTRRWAQIRGGSVPIADRHGWRTSWPTSRPTIVPDRPPSVPGSRADGNGFPLDGSANPLNTTIPVFKLIFTLNRYLESKL